MKVKLIIVIFVIVAVVVFYFLARPPHNEASMLLLNGTVYTLDPKQPVVHAVAVSGDRIVGTGSTEEISRRYRAQQVINLEGKTVVPGLIDGHGHVLGEGGRLQTLDLVGTNSIDQITHLVGDLVKHSQSGQWIIGRGWDQNRWEVKEFPRHQSLDEVAPNNPVLLRRVDGHAVWVNATVLRLAGVSSAAKDPPGGKIYRDEHGQPTGVLVDNAIDLIDKVVPELTDAELEQRLKLALEECARFGLTEVHDMGIDLQTIAAYKRLIDRGECPIRVYAAIGGPGPTWDHYLSSGPEIGYGKGMLTVRAVKLYADGALGSRGAALFEEYSDDPGNRGLTLISDSEMESVHRQALSKGFQVCTHAIGDRANYITLSAYEKQLRSLPVDAPSPRWRIEHAQVLQATDITRFHQLGILPSMQPTHATSDMYWVEARLGPDRVKGAYAWRSMLQTGSIIIGGSDFPVESVNPLWGIYAAVTRSDRDGNPAGGWCPDQRMAREEALRSFSQWASYGAFEESTKGTIEVGKWADLTVLSNDIMTIPPKEILSTEVEFTIVGGKVVYQKSRGAQ